VFLAALTFACLLPFSGRAFHVDDPLFVWAGEQIAHSPGNPYGFEVIWDYTRVRMADVTQNPPLASYYIAAVGSQAGFSERPLHLAFLVFAILLVAGVYRLAQNFTKYPLLAAIATLVTPGVLVSASSVMCDTMMLAFWVWALVFWVEGLEPERASCLVLSALLMSAAFLTKYFAAALIVLIAIYSLARLRRVGRWAMYLAIPVASIYAYQHWSAVMYGQGLVTRAGIFSQGMRAYIDASWAARGIMVLGFTGGCTVTVFFFAPLVWPRLKVFAALAAGALLAAAILSGWVRIGRTMGGEGVLQPWKDYAPLLGLQWSLYIAGGLAVLGLVISEGIRGYDVARGVSSKKLTKKAARNLWEESRAKIAVSALLGLWILGTLVFAGFVNWTVNARSVLPLIPPAGILLARQFELRFPVLTRQPMILAAIALSVSGIFSLWVAASDAALANTARTVATRVRKMTEQEGPLYFEGHWGFQYYLEQLGGEPLDLKHPQAKPGDQIAIPFNNVWTANTPPYTVTSEQNIFIPVHTGVTTIGWPLGAGFYSSYWGPMPFGMGPQPMQGARVFRVGEKKGQ